MLLGDSNTKLKKTSKRFNVKIYNFSLPAYKSNTGKVVCAFADTCVKFCYARDGFYRFSNVQQGLEKRYQESKKDTFVHSVIEEIKGKRTKLQKYIRIHDSGDFYSREYLNKWLEIAKSLPNTRFYAYTKAHDLFRGIELPKNFDVIFSEGSKLDHKLNTTKERHARIFNTLKELKEAKYTDAHEYDLFATKWFSINHKIGLVLH